MEDIPETSSCGSNSTSGERLSRKPMPGLAEASSDKQLIKLCLQGNQHALFTLIRRHQPSLIHYARGCTVAEEETKKVVKRALRRGFVGLSRLRRNSLFSSYLIGVLRKELARIGRGHAASHATTVWKALAGLPRVQREVVFLFFMGYSLQEVARIRDEPLSHSRSRLANALARLVRRLKKSESPSETSKEGTEQGIPPGCLDDQQICLAALQEPTAKPTAESLSHLEICQFCRNRRDEAVRAFEAVMAEIKEAACVPPLVESTPRPYRLSGFLAVAAVLVASLLIFFLARSYIFKRIEPGKSPNRAGPTKLAPLLRTKLK